MKPFTEKGLSFERLKSLVSVRERGGIARAAPGNVAKQNLIGRQLRELETFFGTKLTSRQGKMLTLNTEGQKLATTASQILFLIEDFRATAQGKRKNFHLAAGGTLYDELASRRLPLLKEYLLQIHLTEITQPKIFNALLEARIDAAIAWGTPPSSYRLKSISLGKFDYALYGTRSLLASQHKEKELFRLPFAIVSYRDMSIDLEKRVESNEIVRVDENTSAMHLVSSGHYVAVLPKLLGDQLPKAKFRAVTLDFLAPYTRKVALYWDPRHSELRGFSSSWMEALSEKFMITRA